MRPGTTRSLFRYLASDRLEAVVLIEILPIGANSSNPLSVIRLTSAGQECTVSGKTYKPITMALGTIEEVVATDSGNVPSVTLTVTNVDEQMAELLNRAELEGAKATVYLTDRRLLGVDDRAITLTKGEVRELVLTERTLVFQVVNAIGIAEAAKVPRRIFQAHCNYAYGSTSCGVDLKASPNMVATTALSGSNEHWVVVDASVLALAGATDPTEYWKNGYVVWKDGPAACMSQSIQRVTASDNRFYFERAFIVNPGLSNMVIVRGCPKTTDGCALRQPDGTPKNFGGFPDVPYGRVKPVYLGREQTLGAPHFDETEDGGIT